MWRAIATVAVVLTLGVSALHEDEQGKYDWHRPGVGHIAMAVFHPYTKVLKSVHVASHKNIVASFGIKGGDMRWRYALGTNDNVTCLTATEKYVFVGTESGLVLALDAAKGKVVRSAPLSAKGIIGCGLSENDNELRLVAVDLLQDGTLGGNSVSYATLSTKLRDMTGEALPVKDWPELSEAVKATDGSSRAQSAAVLSNGAVIVKTTSQHVVGARTWGGDKASVIAAVKLPDGVYGRFRGATCASSAVLQGCSSATRISLEASAITIGQPSDAASLTALLVCPEIKNSPAAIGVDGRGFVTLGAKLGSDAPASGMRVLAGAVPKILAVRHDEANARTEVVLGSGSGAMQYLRFDAKDGGKMQVGGAWTFEAGLGDVDKVVFPKERSSLTAWVEAPRTAKFGLKDRIVLISKYGMLFSLNSGTGGNEIEWKAYPAADATIHYPQTRKHCFSVTSLADKGDLITVRLTFHDDAKTVVQLSYDVFSGRIAAHSASKLQDAAVFLPDGLVLDSNHKLVSGDSSPHTYHVVSAASGEISGYALEATATQAAKAWTVSLGARIVASAVGSADLRAVSSVEHMRYLPNATTGAKDIRRKYPTANVLVTCHYVTDEDAAANADSDDELASPSTLVVTAIDTISGQILGTMRHANAEGKVSVTIAEHMVIYTFMSVKTMRAMIGVWELFETQDVIPQDSQYTSPALIVMSFLEKRRTFVPEKVRPPLILSQLLAFVHGEVASVGVTVTSQGIARKLVVFATSEGTVVTVPLTLLAIGGISETPHPGQQKAPPKATIFMPSTSMITYKHRVTRPTKVFSAPTPLESTSHVLVTGVDLFYSRVSSGKPFDMVDEDNNRLGLVIGIVALPVAALFLRMVASKRTLRLAWS